MPSIRGSTDPHTGIDALGVAGDRGIERAAVAGTERCKQLVEPLDVPDRVFVHEIVVVAVFRTSDQLCLQYLISGKIRLHRVAQLGQRADAVAIDAFFDGGKRIRDRGDAHADRTVAGRVFCAAVVDIHGASDAVLTE